jgi:integrase
MLRLISAFFRNPKSPVKNHMNMSKAPLPMLAETAQTLADARRYLLRCDAVAPGTRRNLLSGLSGIARVCGLPEAAIELSCPNLRRLLYRKPPAAYGFTPQRFGKLIGALRFVMRGLDLHAPQPAKDGLSPFWQSLRDALPEYRQIALSGIIAFCSDAGVNRENASPDLLGAFEHVLINRTLEPDPAGLARRSASNWEWARSNVEPWAGLPELHRPGMRDHYTLPFSSYPTSFQEDVRRFAARLVAKDPGTTHHDAVTARTTVRRRRRAARPRTVETRLHQLRQAAAALVLTGVPIAELRSLLDLVVPIEERAAQVRAFFVARSGDEPNSQVAGILETLRQVACHHCQLPPDVVGLIAGWVSQARPDWRAGMTEKNRRRLRALIQRRPRAMLLHFPRELLRRAQAKSLTPKAAARLVAHAVALEIELIFPMRRANLAGLRLDQHLQRLGPGGRRVTDIFLSKEEMKNRNGMEWPLPKETADLIEIYLRRYRPHLMDDPANPFLFPSRGTYGRTAHELSIGLCSLIARELGVEINLHLLRHFGGWLYLQRNPGHYEVLRQVLGHKKIEVTIACYTGLEADASASHFDEGVLQERAETRHVAQAAFRKPTRNTRRGARS